MLLTGVELDGGGIAQDAHELIVGGGHLLGLDAWRRVRVSNVTLERPSASACAISAREPAWSSARPVCDVWNVSVPSSPS